MSRGAPPWVAACDAAALIAIDPIGLGGAVLRARPGPVRERWLAFMRTLVEGPIRRVPIHVDDDRLLGGVDLTATLKAGRAVGQRGLLAEADGGLVIAAMAERMSEHVAALLAAALDRGVVQAEREGLTLVSPAAFALVALDEGVDAEERAHAQLHERLAFHLDLEGIAPRDAPDPDDRRAEVAAARARLPLIAVPGDDVLETVVATAAAFGIASLRAPMLTLRAARAHAALRGGEAIAEEDLVAAVRLVLAPRALVLPSSPDDPAPDEPPPEPETNDPGADEQPQALADRVLEAVAAVAPEDLLAQIAANVARQRTRGAAGAKSKSNARGRPAGVRAGRLRPGERLDIPATLRAAAGWQSVRRRTHPADQARLIIHADDFRLQRRISRAEATVIFVVDASGSAALHRMAECKGAVELLLAQAYVRRTRAALIAFRNASADLLLAPTRSLTRAKRALADLPGGGGTPLAAALDAALQLALAEKSKGRTPSVVLMTDGRANVTRAGEGGRAEAEAEALEAARAFRVFDVGAAFIDSGQRPRPEARVLADAMGARYVPLPFPQARAMADVVQSIAP